jgi:hypothetical protein
MMPTFKERQRLASDFAAHVARMQRCLQSAGRCVSDDEIVRAWVEYSDAVCAGWLMPPDDDSALLEILCEHLPSGAGMQPPIWHTTMLAADDGSGDGILELPDELMAQMGWKEGDTMSITKTDSGELILRRVQE